MNQGSRMGLKEQVEKGLLACPETHQPLAFSDDMKSLSTADGTKIYPVLNQTIPVLLQNPAKTREYFEKTSMAAEYADESVSPRSGLKGWIHAVAVADYRSEQSEQAFRENFPSRDGSRLYLAVGGGPQRDHAAFVNLNIGPFPNVDIVADAHKLPYADSSVDGIYCCAVMEHLYDPAAAVREMFRVLKPGATAFLRTPFLQPYHGYPHHYQNFTLTGHMQAFKATGFDIESSGVDVGPSYALWHMIQYYLQTYYPRLLVRPVLWLWWIFGSGFLKRRDLSLNKRPDAHMMASTTFLVARKVAG